MHCAPQDKLLLKQTPESFRSVLGAKVSGLLAMGSALELAPLHNILLFSSVSSIVAPLGQPNYAAANAMLNAWANAQGTQVTSCTCNLLAKGCTNQSVHAAHVHTELELPYGLQLCSVLWR